MTMHMGDEFSRAGTSSSGSWRPEEDPRVSGSASTAGAAGGAGRPDQHWDQASRDATNESMLEKGIIQPGDL